LLGESHRRLRPRDFFHPPWTEHALAGPVFTREPEELLPLEVRIHLQGGATRFEDSGHRLTITWYSSSVMLYFPSLRQVTVT
jgi:hypothetical protein